MRHAVQRPHSRPQVYVHHASCCTARRHRRSPRLASSAALARLTRRPADATASSRSEASTLRICAWGGTLASTGAKSGKTAAPYGSAGAGLVISTPGMCGGEAGLPCQERPPGRGQGLGGFCLAHLLNPGRPHHQVRQGHCACDHRYAAHLHMHHTRSYRTARRHCAGQQRVETATSVTSALARTGRHSGCAGSRRRWLAQLPLWASKAPGDGRVARASARLRQTELQVVQELGHNQNLCPLFTLHQHVTNLQNAVQLARSSANDIHMCHQSAPLGCRRRMRSTLFSCQQRNHARNVRRR